MSAMFLLVGIVLGTRDISYVSTCRQHLKRDHGVR